MRVRCLTETGDALLVEYLPPGESLVVPHRQMGAVTTAFRRLVQAAVPVYAWLVLCGNRSGRRVVLHRRHTNNLDGLLAIRLETAMEEALTRMTGREFVHGDD